MTTTFTRIHRAITALQQGKMVILTDDDCRENEADLIFPAEKTSAEMINFMLRHTSGIICLSLTQEKLEQLDLPLMVPTQYNTSAGQTPFTLSIDAKKNITTGVSATDRAQTIHTAIQPNATKKDLATPGHIFPLQASEGGVLTRAGHTEGSIDIVQLAGFQSAAVLCELMDPDGRMMRNKNLFAFSEKYQLPLLTIEDIIIYRRCNENLIAAQISAALPLKNNDDVKITVIKEKFTHKEHLVLYKTPISSATPPLVRIHSSCMTGDIFHSQRCDCAAQLHYFLHLLQKEGGLLIYLNQEGRGIGLFEKIKAYALQETGLDTVEANQQLGLPADARNYYFAAQILRQFNWHTIRLLTNNPQKINDLHKYGIAVVHRQAIPPFMCNHNKHYLLTKHQKLHHQLFN